MRLMIGTRCLLMGNHKAVEHREMVGLYLRDGSTDVEILITNTWARAKPRACLFRD